MNHGDDRVAPDLCIAVGERVDTGTRTLRLTERLAQATLCARRVLSEAASYGLTLTYSELAAEIEAEGGPSVFPRHLGPVLVMLDEDCRRRDEPGLAALVVSATTGEVGTPDTSWAPPQRQACWRYWSSLFCQAETTQ